jgi:hypothetical protein
MPRRIHPNFDRTTTLDEVFGEGKRAFDEWKIHGNKFQFYKAEAWLEHCQQTIPKNCSAATRLKLRRAITQALYLCRAAKIEDLVNKMSWADNERDYHEDCGTKALWHLYLLFCRKIGGQHIDFRSYVEAAARASLKSVWQENESTTLLSVAGSESKRLTYLVEYAQRLGFVVDGANDADGNVAVVLVGVRKKGKEKIVAKSKNLVTKSKQKANE